MRAIGVLRGQEGSGARAEVNPAECVLVRAELAHLEAAPEPFTELACPAVHARHEDGRDGQPARLGHQARHGRLEPLPRVLAQRVRERRFWVGKLEQRCEVRLARQEDGVDKGADGAEALYGRTGVQGGVSRVVKDWLAEKERRYSHVPDRPVRQWP